MFLLLVGRSSCICKTHHANFCCSSFFALRDKCRVDRLLLFSRSIGTREVKFPVCIQDCDVRSKKKFIVVEGLVP